MGLQARHRTRLTGRTPTGTRLEVGPLLYELEFYGTHVCKYLGWQLGEGCLWHVAGERQLGRN